MAYFSTGSEGMDYEAHYCRRCVHDPPADSDTSCTVWMLHLLFNGEQHKDGVGELAVHGPTVAQLLGELIPTSKDGLGNLQCSMFVPRADARITGGDSWCASFKHHQPMQDRNAGAPCLLCLVDEGMTHAALA